MAPSSTFGKNRINEGSHQYPYTPHANVAIFLPLKLSGKSYYEGWRDQMTCLLVSHDMLGFIDGTLKKPEKNMPSFEAKYSDWKRSDSLVKGWIYGSLSDSVMKTVVGLETASDVWNKLQTDYTTPNALATPPAPPVTETREKDVGEYIPLCRAIQMGDWEKAQEFFNEDKDALTGKLEADGTTALHVAVGDPKNISILQKLLEQIESDSLPTLVDTEKLNALHLAAILDNMKAAEKLVEKNKDLLFIIDKDEYLPIQRAILNAHKTTFVYLLQVCKEHIGLSQKEGSYSPFEGERGAFLVINTISSGFFDVALDLLKDYPQLATTLMSSKSPLWSIAKMSDAYPSAKQFNFYQRFVYSRIGTQNYKSHDVENQETYRSNLVTECTKSYVYPVFQRIYVKFWEVAVLHVPHIKLINEAKVKHNNALMILKFICEEVAKLGSDHSEHYRDAFIVAVNNDTKEVIQQITSIFPNAIWTYDGNGYRLPQLSIINRCENVYNFLVHEVTQNKYLHNIVVDKDKNNLLHLVGRLAPTHKLSKVTGAALQMQRELVWFEEVKQFMRPREREAQNNNGETPIMVFREEHEALRKAGEEWMKKTADSYTITAALIITIVFAAAITVPGGTNGENGKPIHGTKLSFIIFVVSDAISLFTSTTSLSLFLYILTARYAEDDFLYKLPSRLMKGLVMLFFSVTAMIIAFCATLYIMFAQGKSRILILILIVASACLPIASFLALQFPLLLDLYSYTYGRGIFRKQSEHRITS